MSRIHVVFTNREHKDHMVVYQVHSPDFSDGPLIGEIRFDIAAKRYEFMPMGALQGQRVIPPQVFELPEDQREEIIRNEFSGYAYGGWTSRIARMASRLLDNGEFPAELYGAT